MSRIQYISYKSWSEYKTFIIKELFENEIFKEGDYLFRGQGSAEWSLSTSFDRWIQVIGKRNAVEDAKRLLEFYKKECEKLNLAENRLNDDVYMTALGQHFGLPTRLLDWSRSPYISAFFAFNEAFLEKTDEVKTGYVAIWALKRNSDIWGPDRGVEIIDIPPSENYRYLNQEGIFTLSRTPFDSLEKYVQAFGDGEPALLQFSLPRREAKIAMADLASMGLTHTRLFPDFGGCAFAAKMRMIMALKF